MKRGIISRLDPKDQNCPLNRGNSRLAAAIGRILFDKEERERLERVARFRPSLVYGRHLALLKELAGQ